MATARTLATLHNERTARFDLAGIFQHGILFFLYYSTTRLLAGAEQGTPGDARRRQGSRAASRVAHVKEDPSKDSLHRRI